GRGADDVYSGHHAVAPEPGARCALSGRRRPRCPTKRAGESTPGGRAMRTNTAAVLIVLAAALIGLSIGDAMAQSGKTLKIRFGNSQGLGETTADTMADFKKEVEAKSNGQIQVELYPSGQLGKIEEVVEMLRSGAVQMHVNSPQYLAKWYPEIQVTSLPYLFDSPEAADRTLDGPFGTELRAKIQEKTDFVIMGYEEYGLKHVFN